MDPRKHIGVGTGYPKQNYNGRQSESTAFPNIDPNFQYRGPAPSNVLGFGLQYSNQGISDGNGAFIGSRIIQGRQYVFTNFYLNG